MCEPLETGFNPFDLIYPLPDSFWTIAIILILIFIGIKLENAIRPY